MNIHVLSLVKGVASRTNVKGVANYVEILTTTVVMHFPNHHKSQQYYQNNQKNHRHYNK